MKNKKSSDATDAQRHGEKLATGGHGFSQFFDADFADDADRRKSKVKNRRAKRNT